MGVRLHRRTTVWGERRSGSHVTSCAAATDGAPCLWGAHLPHRLPTPSIAHPVRCLGRWSRLGARPQSVGSAFAPPLHCVLGRATIWVSCDVLCRCDRWRPLLVGGTPTAPLANSIHSAPYGVLGAVVPVGGASTVGWECVCTAAPATICVLCDVLCRCDRWRPLLVGGTPTAPLANTIHSAHCAVLGAVVPVGGASTVSWECVCTAAPPCAGESDDLGLL